MEQLYGLQEDYRQWLTELKSKIRFSQIKAAVAVNSELIHLYWKLGQQIVEKQENTQWGSGFIERLSKDLQMEFPDIGGFSYRNLRRCKQLYLFYNQGNTIRPHLVAKLEDDSLFQIPWGHHGLIMERIKVVQEALFYIHKTIENGWSRAILEYHIFVSLSTTFLNFIFKLFAHNYILSLCSRRYRFPSRDSLVRIAHNAVNCQHCFCFFFNLNNLFNFHAIKHYFLTILPTHI